MPMTPRADSYVYVLFRADGLPLYVGKGRGRRWLEHELKARRGVRGHLMNIIRKMFAAGLTEVPKIKVAEGLTDAQASVYEIAFVAAIGRKPHGPLVNQTAGGDGVVDLSAEARAKIAAGQRGRIHSVERRARLSAVRRGKRQSPEVIAKRAAAMRGHVVAPETRAKIGAANAVKRRGTKSSPEARAKISARLIGNTYTRGFKHTAETRAKVSAAGLGHAVSAETRAKIGAKHKGKTVSPETRAKMSAAKRGKPQSAEWIAARRTGMLGHVCSPETRAKLSAANKGQRPWNKGQLALSELQ